MSSPVTSPPEKMLFQLSLRRRGISDQAVLRALEAVPRDRFVDPPYRSSAWRDTALPIACGQTIGQPFVVAYMIEQLSLRESHRVLEIGTGSGYLTAILSRLSKWVLSVERFKTLADSARERLETMRFDNVEVMFGDGFALPDGIGYFDRILVTASIADEPQSLLERLEPGGILIAPVGPPQGRQTLTRFHRTEDGISRKPLVEVRFVPALRGVAREL